VPSIQSYAFRPILGASRSLMGIVAGRGVGAMLRTVAQIGRISEPMTRFPRGVTIATGRVGGVGGSWLVPRGAPEGPVILFIHGGAFVTPLSGPFLMVAAQLALAAELRVFAVDYRQLPEHVYPAAHDDVFSAYEELARRDTVVVGDSTGGVLALATLLRARDRGLPQPRLCMLLSPAVDYGAAERALGARDAFVHPRFVVAGHAAYVSGHDPSVADLAPVGQDLRGLAPLQVFVGEHELFRAEVDRLQDAARRQGVTIDVRIWPGMWHGWYVMADRLPEGRQALDAAGAAMRLVRPSGDREAPEHA
jgi:acetyl esterase/lipase